MARASTNTACAARLEWMPLGQLQAAKRNPKQHSSEIGTSIGRFGYVEPIVLDEAHGPGSLPGMAARGAAGDAHARRGAPRAFAARETMARAGAARLGVSVAGRGGRVPAREQQATEAGGWDNQALAELLKDLKRPGRARRRGLHRRGA
jgi:hypothetical protein